MTARMGIDTPAGRMLLTESGGEIVGVAWSSGPDEGESPLLQAAAQQIAAYFAGATDGFDLPLRIESGLTGAVQREMLKLAFGETTTYGAIARAVGAPAQAVGQACGANPLPILVPCHRVLGASGLGGYSGSGGVETKVLLLRHEGAAGLLI